MVTQVDPAAGCFNHNGAYAVALSETVSPGLFAKHELIVVRVKGAAPHMEGGYLAETVKRTYLLDVKAPPKQGGAEFGS